MNLWCGYMYNPFLHLHIAAHTFPKLSHEQITEHLQQFSLFPSLWNLFSPLNDDLPAVSNSWISPVFSSCHSLVDIVSPCESVSVAHKNMVLATSTIAGTTILSTSAGVYVPICGQGFSRIGVITLQDAVVVVYK